MKLISIEFRFRMRSLCIQQTLRKDKSKNKYANPIFIQEKNDTRLEVPHDEWTRTKILCGHSGVVCNSRKRLVVRNRVIS